MDAVNFSIKRTHLALNRLGRTLLRPHGLTPARFDLMFACEYGITQSELWRRLEVVRSVVCEMLGALEKLGWVERIRAGRTRLVRLTATGRALFEKLLAEYVQSGDVGAWVDHALELVDDDPVVLALRQGLIDLCTAIRWTFRARPPFQGPELYVVLGSPS
jgi:DNA-binding MarR family transcriptional regulator